MDWKMPDLGEGVQEAEIIKWLVKEGERISIDQHLVEVMTDKAAMEIPSSVEGVVQKIVVKEGQVTKIGQVLAVIGEGAKGVMASPPEFTPSEAEGGARKDIGKKNLASPAVRQLARELGIDLDPVQGSGPGGRITKEDLEGKGPKRLEAGQERRQPLRGLRRKIAEHMALSRKTAVHFTHFDEADLTDLVALRESTKTAAQSKGVHLTYLPYIIKAVIAGLKKFPQINASLDEERQEIILKGYYNLGFAVATEEGLIVPVVKNADQCDLWGLAKEMTRLGKAARDRTIALEDLKGGTFTITNIGSIGGIFSAPIINYPEVAILGVHQIKPRVMVKDGKMTIRQMTYLSLSADHRVVDGAEAAAFMKEVIGHLEKPSTLF